MAGIRTILAELIKLNTVYPRPKTQSELEAMAEIWAEDCSSMTDLAFREAVAQARKTVRYFPTPADVALAYRDQVARQPTQTTLPGKTYTRDDERHRMNCANVIARAQKQPMPFPEEYDRLQRMFPDRMAPRVRA